MTRTTPIATRHTARPAPPARTRLGSLIWWRFQRVAADIADLAAYAKNAGYPDIYLPLPDPVESEVAFNRMVRAGERVIEGNRWLSGRVETAEVAGRPRLPDDVRDWIRTQGEDLLIAVAERREPDQASPEPWRVWLWICLRTAAGAEYLPTMDLVRVFMVVETRSSTPEALDITDHVIKAAGSSSEMDRETAALVDRVERNPQASRNSARTAAAILRIAALQYGVLDRERTLATSPEIGDGVMLALEEQGGVRLRPGLFVVPGESGVKRCEATVKYLLRAPDTDAGMMDIHGSRRSLSLVGLVRPVLLEEIERLAQKIAMVKADEIGTRALGTLVREVAALEERLTLNKPVLGSGFKELWEAVAKTRQMLEERMGPIKPQAVSGGARRGRPTLDCANLQRRLRKLKAAARHASLSQAHGSEAEARRRVKALDRAVARAEEYVAHRCTPTKSA